METDWDTNETENDHVVQRTSSRASTAMQSVQFPTELEKHTSHETVNSSLRAPYEKETTPPLTS